MAKKMAYTALQFGCKYANVIFNIFKLTIQSPKYLYKD